MPLNDAGIDSGYVAENTTVSVVGLGYIGLPTASVLATKGFRVFGTDVQADVVDMINQGRIHIKEPDLDILVRSAVNSGQLSAGHEPKPADVFIICVPTPIRPDHAPDLSYVERACQAIRPHVQAGNLVILESTSPPRTTVDVVSRQAIPPEHEIGRDVFVAHCPERVLPGRILMEVVQNDRVVGGMTPRCTAKAKQFYESFVNGSVLATSALSAEVTKLVENSYRDVNIAFANELATLCDRLGTDVWEVIELANRHPRVDILSPGPGVGGHCISVDPWFLIHADPDHTPLMRAARNVNDAKPKYVARHVAELARQFADPKIGCLGLTYKADVDDLRESPSVEIVQLLSEMHCGQLMACDPYLSPRRFSQFKLYPLETVLKECQLLALLTDHRQFKTIPRRVLQEKIIVDTRGIWR
jgi:UDP-N-acetyl-D-mannosaminuronic acid dehydrogenase